MTDMKWQTTETRSVQSCHYTSTVCETVYDVSIIVSSVCLPLSSLCRALALRSSIAFRSLSIFSFTMTTYHKTFHRLYDLYHVATAG